MIRQNNKNPPSLFEEEDYYVWENEVEMWVLGTDLPKRKQAVALALSLTGKYRLRDNLNADDVMSELIAELDKSFKRRLREHLSVMRPLRTPRVFHRQGWNLFYVLDSNTRMLRSLE